MNGQEFVDIHKKTIDFVGFWSEEYKSNVIHSIESKFKREILKEYCVTDFVINGDKVLVKWTKRFRELTDEELIERYGNEQQL